MTTPGAKNGCFNHPPYDKVVLVQFGWSRAEMNSRNPVMKLISNPNSKDCQYSRSAQRADDPKCQGCKWKQPVQDMP